MRCPARPVLPAPQRARWCHEAPVLRLETRPSPQLARPGRTVRPVCSLALAQAAEPPGGPPRPSACGGCLWTVSAVHRFHFTAETPQLGLQSPRCVVGGAVAVPAPLSSAHRTEGFSRPAALLCANQTVHKRAGTHSPASNVLLGLQMTRRDGWLGFRACTTSPTRGT